MTPSNIESIDDAHGINKFMSDFIVINKGKEEVEIREQMVSFLAQFSKSLAAFLLTYTKNPEVTLIEFSENALCCMIQMKQMTGDPTEIRQ